jgi:CubicO group peptidase (beta-lactamase class C family)
MTRVRFFFVLLLVCTTSVLASSGSPAAERKEKENLAARLAGFDDFVNDALRKWEVPGLALAVVADGEVILAKGYGLRDIKNNQPMTPDTLLAIGSITKSFTTFVMGQLVDEGKLDWDKPVRNYLPEFRMLNVSLAEGLTPRDLVTHRSGVPRHDLVWYNNQELSRKELVTRLGALPPNAELRERYQYNNLMFLTAGYLIEQLTKMTWEDAVRSRIFGPLGMRRSNFSDADSQKDPDHAQPYRRDADTEKIIEIPFRELGNMGPAGSINSSVNEMSRWVMVQVNQGKFGGRQIIEPTTLREMHTPQVSMGVIPDQREVSPPSYGMGWVVDGYRGHYRVWHTGGIDGFSALVTLYPNDGIGIVALTNASGSSLHSLVRDHAIDRLLDLPRKDWSGEALAKRDLARKSAKEARAKRQATRKAGTSPSHPLDDYAGEYQNDGYGVLRIEKGGKDGLQATYNHIVTPLEHWHYDVFNGVKNEKDPVFEDMKYNFRTDVAGNVAAVEAAFETNVPPVVFRRKPDTKLSDPAFLKQFTGEYTMGGQKVLLSLRGTQLVLTIGNGRPTVLEPDIDGWFNLKGLSGFRAHLLPDRIEISQPNGLFTATREQKTAS